ncbi:phenol hydroxylase subunit P4 [Marinobacterium sp. YM272]|uniref:phenol hydroxylase subunit P4 n=1 Tax=Marinobacterium sp. YM272 TaxID=3421654 RepID=UPI003D7F985C
MPVHAYTPDYTGTVRDKVENFHGNQLVYVCWERHLLFACPFAFLLSSQITFRQLRDEVMAEAYSAHPQWQQIDWDQALWTLSGEAFQPALDKTLEQQGIDHKASLRFSTPGLEGLFGAGI